MISGGALPSFGPDYSLDHSKNAVLHSICCIYLNLKVPAFSSVV